MGGNDAEFIVASDIADTDIGLAILDGVHRRPHPLDWLEDAPGPEYGENTGPQHGDAEQAGDGGDGLFSGSHERAFEKADVEHADPLPVAVEQRLVGGNVPFVDDEGAVEPSPPFVKHRTVHRGRDAGADGARITEQPDVGRDAYVVEKEGGRARAAEGQGAFGVNDGVEAIDEIEVLVEQHAALQDADHNPVGILDWGGGLDNQAARLHLALIGTCIGGG